MNSPHSSVTILLEIPISMAVKSAAQVLSKQKDQQVTASHKAEDMEVSSYKNDTGGKAPD